ncbi:MAG TPA: hypothetical protein VFI31_13565 [Pirellulales bacterium]|nr:hypothetical protein [Pirellulales bacterium]
MPDWKTLAVTAVLALVFGVGGAWGYSALFGPSKSDEQSRDSDQGGKSGGGQNGKQSGGKSGGDKEKSKGSSSESGGASASEIPGFNSAQDAETFKKELEHLAHRLDLLGGRIDNLTTNKEKTPPVLHTMQTKMTDLEREVDQIANLPAKFSRLERKTSDLEQEFKSLKERMTGAETPIATDLSPSGLGSDKAELPAADADPADEATLNLAAGLLREGHYSQSYEVLRRLQRARPKDARVWYLSALANGLATGNWDGKTKQLAEQGIACERSGRPSHIDIDETLSGIDSAEAMSWMAELRKDVKTR